MLTGTVDTYAGNGINSYVDSNLTNSSFSYPHGLAMHNNGDLYVADTGNNVIRCINKLTGNVTTVAGKASIGGVLIDGDLLESAFNSPMSIIFDNFNNLYVADALNHVIRYVNFNTIAVSTYAGTGVVGDVLGLRMTARFNRPTGLALDGSSNLYIADTLNDCIKVINYLTNIVSVYAGDKRAGFADGPAIYAEFNKPQGVLYNLQEQALYVADTANHSIRKIKTS